MAVHTCFRSSTSSTVYHLKVGDTAQHGVQMMQNKVFLSNLAKLT